MKLKFSIEGKLTFIVFFAISVSLIITYLCVQWIEHIFLAYLLALLFSFTFAVYCVRVLCKSLRLRIDALHNGMLNLMDNDFSISLAVLNDDELSDVIVLFNQVTEKLRVERQHVYQRELLLDTVIQNSSLCLVLTDHSGRIIYSNYEARQLFNQGKAIQGLIFDEVLQQAPAVLRDVIKQGKNGLFNIGEGQEENAYHLSLGRFVLNTQRHNLYLVKQMTRELNRQEAATWKKVIRIISHELNNSLAPISSMAHSGSLMLKKNKTDSLPKVFETISERAEHLNDFIDGYARLAKLPLPNKEEIEWADFIGKLSMACPFTLVEDLPVEKAYFDEAQLSQVLVNLFKNSLESGSNESDITLKIRHNNNQALIEIADRGKGMSSKVMENALLPFYTTKLTGSGVGLPLCREIVEGHDGEMSLSNRAEGGFLVRLLIPLKTGFTS